MDKMLLGHCTAWQKRPFDFSDKIENCVFLIVGIPMLLLIYVYKVYVRLALI